MAVIIDNTTPDFADCPPTLNGAVLLERTVDNGGNHSGFLTITRDYALQLKAMTDAQLQANGYYQYKAILGQVV